MAKSVRYDDTMISIDVKKGEWPHVTLMLVTDETDTEKLAVIVDANHGGSIVGESGGVGIVPLSLKKARIMRDWLNKALD